MGGVNKSRDPDGHRASQCRSAARKAGRCGDQTVLNRSRQRIITEVGRSVAGSGESDLPPKVVPLTMLVPTGCHDPAEAGVAEHASAAKIASGAGGR